MQQQRAPQQHTPLALCVTCNLLQCKLYLLLPYQCVL